MPPAPAEIPQEAVVAPSPATNGASTDDPKQEVKEELRPEVSMQEQPTYGNGSNGVGSGWQNGHGTGEMAHDYGDMAIDPEPHGTGIKEDG